MSEPPDTTEAPFRLAIRAEGDYVNAYFAAMTTMEGAMLLGSMRRSILENNPAVYERWRVLLQEVLSEACVEALGTAPVEYDTRPAPEHERSGRG